MTAPGDGEESAPTAGPGRPRRRLVLVVAAAVAVLVGCLGLTAVWAAQDDEPGLLDSDAPGLSQFTMEPGGRCTFDPDRGGLVAHFSVRTSDAGTFSVDVEAHTAESAGNADLSTPHVVRYTVPFYGGRTTKEFDVVVPLTRSEYDAGYRTCRYTVGDAG